MYNIYTVWFGVTTFKAIYNLYIGTFLEQFAYVLPTFHKL